MLKLFNKRINTEIIKDILKPPKTPPRSLLIIPKEIILTSFVIALPSNTIVKTINKKVVPKPGQVLDESHLINTDRDWVDRVDWDTKQNRASMLLETSSERKPWEHVIEETRWGTGKELLGSEPDPLKTVNVTENAANATDPEFLREQELAKMLSDKEIV